MASENVSEHDPATFSFYMNSKTTFLIKSKKESQALEQSIRTIEELEVWLQNASKAKNLDQEKKLACNLLIAYGNFLNCAVKYLVVDSVTNLSRDYI